MAWAILIFYMSTQSFGSSSTQILLAWGFDLLHIHVSGHTLSLFNEVIRKLAHATEYAVLALFLYGPPDEHGRNLWKPRRALLSVLAAALYSLTDEFHQIFVPGRGPSLRDCGLDTLGAALAMLVPFTSHQIYLQKNQPTGTL